MVLQEDYNEVIKTLLEAFNILFVNRWFGKLLFYAST